nr:hypothetical protein [Tanacetum cinerariifolium]
PTVYVSHIRQFWSTARIKTTEDGTKILATVDGMLRTVSESSIRRNLKLNDEAGISSLPDVELFENLQLMGYNILPNQKFTFQKGKFSHQLKYLIHTIMQCLSPKSTGFNELSSNIATALGEGSGTSTDSHHTPSPEVQQTSPTTHLSSSLLPVTTATIPPVIPTESLPTVILSDNPPLRQYTRRTRIAQSLVLPPVADEPASPLGDDKMVAKFEAQELEINSLKARIKVLEDKDRGVAEQSRDDAPIKGRRLDEGEEEAKRVSNDIEELATVLTSMDAASILTSGGAQVVPTAAKVPTATVSIPAGSGVVSTASPIIPIAAPIFTTATESTPYTRRKGKEKMVESDTPKKKSYKIVKYLQEYEQIPKDLSIGERVELISDLVKYQENYAQVLKYQTLQRNPRSKKQKKDYYMVVIKGHAGWKTKDFKGMSFEQIEAKFNTFWKQIEDFIPMGSKEETERFKRKGLRLEQVSAKKLKTSEEVPEEVKATKEVPEEKVHTEGQRSYWKITRLGGSSASYQFFVDVLKHLDREDLNQLWRLVKESLNIRLAASDKEMELWVELKRLYEPDAEDQLWTHTQNLMHALVEWKLYDACGVHHVTSKDKEIFMLVEKDYPLRKGLAIVMICYKLQGRIVGNKLHKAFQLSIMEFPLLKEVPTASEECSHCQKKRDDTAEKIALLLKSSSNCQSKSNDSYAKLVPHVYPCILGVTGNLHQDLKDKGVIESGCSRHMIGNKSYLIDYEEINGGFVAFGGNSKRGKITGKGKIRTDFKLTSECHVLLKVPRKDNMYSVDLKNIVP